MISWLQITSGRGPEECSWVVTKLADAIIKEAKALSIKAEILEVILYEHKPKIFKSVLMALEGENLKNFIKQFEGTVQWIGKSVFRPHHKRKNWFVGVKAFLQPEDNQVWTSKEFKVETMRASGAGGQHVNKTESAVRITHISTGLSAIAQEERSQHLNKKLAFSRLNQLLEQRQGEAALKEQNKRWNEHNSLERGNPVRVYQGGDFRLKKAN